MDRDKKESSIPYTLNSRSYPTFIPLILLLFKSRDHILHSYQYSIHIPTLDNILYSLFNLSPFSKRMIIMALGQYWNHLIDQLFPSYYHRTFQNQSSSISSLPFQILIYFNMTYYPIWLISTIMTLYTKVSKLVSLY